MLLIVSYSNKAYSSFTSFQQHRSQLGNQHQRLPNMQTALNGQNARSFNWTSSYFPSCRRAVPDSWMLFLFYCFMRAQTFNVRQVTPKNQLNPSIGPHPHLFNLHLGTFGPISTSGTTNNRSVIQAFHHLLQILYPV